MCCLTCSSGQHSSHHRPLVSLADRAAAAGATALQRVSRRGDSARQRLPLRRLQRRIWRAVHTHRAAAAGAAARRHASLPLVGGAGQLLQSGFGAPLEVLSLMSLASVHVRHSICSTGRCFTLNCVCSSADVWVPRLQVPPGLPAGQRLARGAVARRDQPAQREQLHWPYLAVLMCCIPACLLLPQCTCIALQEATLRPTSNQTCLPLSCAAAAARPRIARSGAHAAASRAGTAGTRAAAVRHVNPPPPTCRLPAVGSWVSGAAVGPQVGWDCSDLLR